ncbi:hypothetical protein [Sulfurimonas sp.]|uniref:hypothetical protein n=1 Tax=Sulfurimonas sp. TaxID=2022749 RepID=UPI002B477C88|nr:hypothetical protein [Sulfurimonas sp.]
MKYIVLILFLMLGLSAKTITPNDSYAQSMLIQEHMHFLLKHYGVKHDHKGILKKNTFSTKLRPRNIWQKSYEILVKINILRTLNNLSRIEPVGMEPVEQLNPDVVYGQTQRVLTEIKIFEVRMFIEVPDFKLKSYTHKNMLDVYNSFSQISAAFDELNRFELSPSYIFAETMRIYDDLTIILAHLNIKDETIPTVRLEKTKHTDSIVVSMKILEKLQKLQRSVGIKIIDFRAFKKDSSSSDVYTITGMIIAEIQPIKAYIGLISSVTPPALSYSKKVPADIEQLMGWNLRKLLLIKTLDRR